MARSGQLLVVRHPRPFVGRAVSTRSTATDGRTAAPVARAAEAIADRSPSAIPALREAGARSEVGRCRAEARQSYRQLGRSRSPRRIRVGAPCLSHGTRGAPLWSPRSTVGVVAELGGGAIERVDSPAASRVRSPQALADSSRLDRSLATALLCPKPRPLHRKLLRIEADPARPATRAAGRPRRMPPASPCCVRGSILRSARPPSPRSLPRLDSSAYTRSEFQ